MCLYHRKAKASVGACGSPSGSGGSGGGSVGGGRNRTGRVAGRSLVGGVAVWWSVVVCGARDELCEGRDIRVRE